MHLCLFFPISHTQFMIILNVLANLFTRNRHTVSQYLLLGQFWTSLTPFLSVNIVYYGAGESNVWTSPAIPRLKDLDSRFTQFHIDEAWLVSCFALGQVFGPLISGCFMDTLGRKPTTLLMVLFLMLSNALLYVGSSATMLYCARVVGGFAFGMSVSVLPVYVAEIADVSCWRLWLENLSTRVTIV